MRFARRRTGRPAAPVLAALLAACQPLPHPFADDRPPASLLAVRDSAGVSIALVVGEPAPVTEKLGGALARALLKRDIPASDKATGLGSYQLYGRVAMSRAQGGAPTLTALWRLYDAEGRAIGERSARLAGTPDATQADSDKLVERLATLSAEQLTPLLVDEAVPQSAAASADRARIRIAVGKISGAPGDGTTSLAAALAMVLRSQDVAVVGDGEKAALSIECDVEVESPKTAKQHVKILWRVRRADGTEIGTVGQENDVPKGTLDAAWGDLAYNIAIAAAEGLAQLVARGAPPAKS